MTRQIAIAICLVAFLTMAVAGVLTYWTARETVLSELDQNLVSRAMTLLPGGDAAPTALPPGDRFIVENGIGQTVSRSPAVQNAPLPRVVSRSFSSEGESRLRTLALETGDAANPTKIIYSSPATAFDRLQVRLARTIAIAVAGGALLTTITAIFISRRVVRPLQTTADVIGTVDDAHLDRRIDAAQVPVELAPMVTRLNQMLARLEEAFRRQAQFFADAAHELRTPVAAMRAGLEIALARPRTQEHLANVMQRTLKETVQFGETVEAMLECVRSGTERRSEPVDLDLSSMLQECMERAQPLAEQRSDTLRRDFPDGLLVHVEAAPLRTVVWNLLSNALAHTPAGGTVQLGARAVGDQVEIEVRDTGQGIPADQLDRIFEPFYRLDPSRGVDHHLGLGLYLVKRHVRRLGGSLDVESMLGRGTTFRVRLPRARDDGLARADSGDASQKARSEIAGQVSSDANQPLMRRT